jgi:hypothetical protein
MLVSSSGHLDSDQMLRNQTPMSLRVSLRRQIVRMRCPKKSKSLRQMHFRFPLWRHLQMPTACYLLLLLHRQKHHSHHRSRHRRLTLSRTRSVQMHRSLRLRLHSLTQRHSVQMPRLHPPWERVWQAIPLPNSFPRGRLPRRMNPDGDRRRSIRRDIVRRGVSRRVGSSRIGKTGRILSCFRRHSEDGSPQSPERGVSAVGSKICFVAKAARHVMARKTNNMTGYKGEAKPSQ